MDRRNFIRNSALVAGIGLPFGAIVAKQGVEDALASEKDTDRRVSQVSESAIDTNVYLFSYPFRNLKYGETGSLIEKLQKHNIGQAWAGSFEALFHKNIDHVNANLARECRKKGGGMLIPFGTVNPVFPDWEEDLRRCHEEHEMPGVRLYPGYHGYTLDEKPFARLLRQAAERELLVQIVIAMEDERMQHPLAEVPNVDVTPLPEVLDDVPGVRIQLLHPFRHVRGDRLREMVNETDVTFGISNLDGVGSLGRIMDGTHWYLPDITITPERLLFGSHVPYFPLENTLFKFMESSLSEEHVRTVMRGNAERLLAVI